MTQVLLLTSTRPYLVRAWHEWCSDNGLTPYVTVSVEASVQVPREYVKDDEIVLNIGFDATTELSINNEYLEFKARFSGVVRDIRVPIDQVMAIFARENGQGMAFPRVSHDQSSSLNSINKADTEQVKRDLSVVQGKQSTHLTSIGSSVDGETSSPPRSSPAAGVRPSLTRIK